MNIKTTLLVKEINILLGARGLEAKGKVQQFIDSEVLRLSDPYIPMDTGKLKQSGTSSTKIGSGEVKWNTPYGKKQYHENKGNGLRGSYWFERMKADHKEAILSGAVKVAGGRSK